MDHSYQVNCGEIKKTPNKFIKLFKNNLLTVYMYEGSESGSVVLVLQGQAVETYQLQLRSRVFLYKKRKSKSFIE